MYKYTVLLFIKQKQNYFTDRCINTTILLFIKQNYFTDKCINTLFYYLLNTTILLINV